MSRMSTLAFVAIITLTTATGAMAATKKQAKVNESAVAANASVATSLPAPIPATYSEPYQFEQAKGCIY